ncbi:MAG: DUF3179 domain-containing protein [Balneolaceae bacterium]|nr:DUF3179 domain-containing protein [Balneolaceae bacterium]
MLIGKILKTVPLVVLVFSMIFMISCNTTSSSGGGSSSVSPESSGSEWLIPVQEVVDGGPGKDGIPSIENPAFKSVNEVNYVQDNRLVIGVKIDDELRLYPHQVMDWHEIVNDEINDQHFSLTYCPLTGTGIAYDREINADINEFGVSGLLYRNNLIMYDRKTDSNWSQMQLRAVNGALSGIEGETIQVVESTWKTWKEIYPEAKVLTTNTGFSRNYSGYAYGQGYLVNDNQFVFQPKRDDDRLENKTIVHAVMESEFRGELTVMRIYPIKKLTDEIQVIQEKFRGKNIVFAGSSSDQLAVSFINKTQDGSILDFEPVQDELPIVMKDNEGNQWNIFGEAVSGPRTGERLTATRSYNGYWFAFADFYPNSCIYPIGDC